MFQHTVHCTASLDASVEAYLHYNAHIWTLSRERGFGGIWTVVCGGRGGGRVVVANLLLSQYDFTQHRDVHKHLTSHTRTLVLLKGDVSRDLEGIKFVNR